MKHSCVFSTLFADLFPTLFADLFPTLFASQLAYHIWPIRHIRITTCIRL
uniref:Uncharacterized protein n=1 Tax=Plasmodium yoelii yoelii TaxID=73239 RepID=Q9XYG3_PLAYO|nr:unknown [Plasmodium yoelii yoelii]